MDEFIRRQLLEEFLGLPQRELPPFNPKLAGEVVQGLLRKFGLKERISEEEMRERWLEAVGEFFAAHSFPERLQDGCLWVRTLQPTVRYEMEVVMKREILAKLQAIFGRDCVRQIRFLHG